MCEQIAKSVEKDVVVVVKSTVPIGTNDEVERYLKIMLEMELTLMLLVILNF